MIFKKNNNKTLTLTAYHETRSGMIIPNFKKGRKEGSYKRVTAFESNGMPRG